MLLAFEKARRDVRFGTEKCIGFPALIAIFDFAVPRDSSLRNGGGRGLLPHILVELAAC